LERAMARARAIGLRRVAQPPKPMVIPSESSATMSSTVMRLSSMPLVILLMCPLMTPVAHPKAGGGNPSVGVNHEAVPAIFNVEAAGGLHVERGHLVVHVAAERGRERPLALALQH